MVILVEYKKMLAQNIYVFDIKIFINENSVNLLVFVDDMTRILNSIKDRRK